MTVELAALNAQWLDFVPPGTPMTREGKPNLAAKAPRTLDGKPDLSGVWQVEPEPSGVIERLYGDQTANLVDGDDPRTRSRYFVNLFVDFKGGDEPITGAPCTSSFSGSNGTANRVPLLR
jgi:hypothetical protein